MSEQNNTNFKFNLIAWMTDQEILKLLGSIPKKDPTIFYGHLEIQTIGLACKMSNEVIIRRVYGNLSAEDQAEFIKISKNLTNTSLKEINDARRIIEQAADQLEIEGEIGNWWQKYAV